jgi:hypothetical protein
MIALSWICGHPRFENFEHFDRTYFAPKGTVESRETETWTSSFSGFAMKLEERKFWLAPEEKDRIQ